MAGRFSVDAVFRAVDRYTRPMRGMERAAHRLRRGLATVGRVTGGITGKLATMTRYAGLAGTAMAGLAARDIVKTGMDFEAAMSGVGAVMLKTREEMESLTAEAKRLGATTKFTGTT